MATKAVKKVVNNPSTEIAGLNQYRYEELSKAYGTIPAASYALNDTLTFPDIVAGAILKVMFVTADGKKLVVIPGVALYAKSGDTAPIDPTGTPIDVSVGTNPGGAAQDVFYEIEYSRKSAAGGSLLKFKFVA